MVLVLAASCTKDLDQQPISAATTETFYGTPSDFIQAVNATYNSLRSYPDRLMILSEVRSDNIYPVNEVARDHDPINNFSPGIVTHPTVNDAWVTNYNGIFKANFILDKIAGNGSILTTALATRLSAEARFLRAMFYFDLVRYFGKVPVVDRAVSAEEANKIPRSPVTEVYALIMADLQFAVANLPATYTGTYPAYTAADAGRATKYAAEALLGQVYMARSGPTYGIEGPGLGLNEWGLALPLFNDVINSGQFVFNTSFTNIFSYTNQAPTANREAIFDVMYLSGQTPVLGATYPWILAPQDYFNWFANTSLANGTLGFPAVSKDLVAKYATADVRRSPTIHTTAFSYTGITYTQPFFRKWLDTTRIPTASRFDWGINYIATRYTDVLLLKAECVLRGAPGSQATDVDGVVNAVRTRAGLPAITGVTLAQLLEERRRELANEGTRWFDLQRSGNLITIMNAWIVTEDAVLHKMNSVTANYILYPVPQSQIDAAPGLYTQNPGY